MKKNKRTVTVLSILIALGAAAASIAGILPLGEGGEREFTSVLGEKVLLEGKGLYRNDPASFAAQGRAQDIVTLSLGIPLLLLSLRSARKGSLRGRLLLAGTLAYFLYSYTSYAFAVFYNELFLLYVFLFSASLAAFVLSVLEIDLAELSAAVSPRFPRRFLGGATLAIGTLLAFMWFGRIIPSLAAGTAPYGLASGSTLPIQVLDLGIIVPACILGGILLLGKRPLGYLVSGIVLMKGATMLVCLGAMLIGEALRGTLPFTAETIIFPLIIISGLAMVFVYLANIGTPGGKAAEERADPAP